LPGFVTAEGLMVWGNVCAKTGPQNAAMPITDKKYIHRIENLSISISE
jgi:hypothetical protein